MNSFNWLGSKGNLVVSLYLPTLHPELHSCGFPKHCSSARTGSTKDFLSTIESRLGDIKGKEGRKTSDYFYREVSESYSKVKSYVYPSTITTVVELASQQTVESF